MTTVPQLIATENKSLLPRSGHKVVADEKYFYVIGGYVERHTILNNYEVRGEIWRYHFINKTWEKCMFDQQLFSLAASHSAVKIGDCIFITGGTGLPFGVNILNSLIVINVRKMSQRIFNFIPKNNNTVNHPIATYGHTMTYVMMNNTPFLFIIGGTTGETYHQEVYQVNLLTLESELVSDGSCKDIPSARYKHEAFLFQDSIYVFGGARGTEYCYSLNQIHIFDIYTKTWSIVTAKVPIPVSLRCPSMSQNGQFVYVCGGYPSSSTISEAVYQLDLSSLSWSQLGTWHSPSFFHDSAFVPHLGALFIFGGVNCILPSHKRNNDLFVLHPHTGRLSRSLIDMAWEIVLQAAIGVVNEEEASSSSSSSIVSKLLLGLGVPGSMVSRVTVSDLAGDSRAA